MPSPPNKIACFSIDYRRGAIEVNGGVHNGCINLEVWQITAGKKLAGLDDENLRDEDFTDNCELELSIREAEELIHQLKAAVETAKSKMLTNRDI